jgi:hypothetical protein
MPQFYKARLGVSNEVLDQLASDLQDDPTPLLRFLHTTSSLEDLSFDDEMKGYRANGGIRIYAYLLQAAPILQRLYIDPVESMADPDSDAATQLFGHPIQGMIDSVPVVAADAWH